MVLFNFIFEFIKISILGCLYATLTLVTFKIIGRYKVDSWFDKVSRKKLRLWFLGGLIISLGLFGYMFTYWGDHGLGDWARIPVGHWRQVIEVDGTRAAIQETNYENGNMIEIEKFEYSSDFLCGKTQEDISKYPGAYFIYDLKTNDVKFFNDKKEYELFANQKGLPMTNDFKTFSDHYSDYWGGWRFWFLA